MSSNVNKNHSEMNDNSITSPGSNQLVTHTDTKTNLSQEERENIQNMNTTQDTNIEVASTDTININNVQGITSVITNTNEIIANKFNSMNNNDVIATNSKPNSENGVVIELAAQNNNDVGTQSNALTDIMNTYSSDSMDEEMFVGFRSNIEDEQKSEDALSSSTSLLSVNEFENSSDDESVAAAPKKTQGVKMKSSRNNGELDLDDLPPIEDLQISVPEEKCLPVGKILNIVNTLVLVKSLKNTPALDLDSVLFLDKGQRSLGQIFDVIGPVSSPVYCVRFNSNQHILDSNIEIDQDVYCAPQTDYTSYVPLGELLNTKGTDASWEKDLEPPPEVLEFSDDEEERQAKRANGVRPRNNRNNQSRAEPDESEPQSKRPTPFEQRMNLRNLLMTASYERRNRINDSSTSRPTKTHTNPNANIIRAPTLPDIPPLPQSNVPPGSTNNNVIPRFGAPDFTPQVRFGEPPNTNLSVPPPLLPPLHMDNPPMNVFTSTPPMASPVCNPLFHQNRKRPPSVSPFTRSPFSPPMFNAAPFTNLPPPPLFSDMLVFSPPPPNGHPGMHFPAPQWSSPPPPNSLPFQFGMPPLIGVRNSTRFRHNTPRQAHMRPAFGSRPRF